LSAPAQITDPLDSALRFITAPYARGASTLGLELGAATAGLSNFAGYTFSTFQARFGVEDRDVSVSYMVTLTAPSSEGPITVEIGYQGAAGSGTARVEIPGGTLPGQSFVVPTPTINGPVFLQTLQERPAPAPGAPSGPDKWRVTGLLGNTARLLALTLGERQAIRATAEDIVDQRHLLTARAASLDRIGEQLRVPRLLPSAYRLDLDPDVIALFHLDDAIAPVVDATGEHPGTNVGAQRGVAGRIGNAAQITAAGGIVARDDEAFGIAAGGSFTIEMFAQLPPMTVGASFTLAVKRPHAADPNGTGWALTATASTAETGTVTFSITDSSGVRVEAVSTDFGLTAFFHVAGRLDGAARKLSVLINGVETGNFTFGSLAQVQNCADIGLGADREGAPLMTGGLLDEVRFSNVARTDFSNVLAGMPYSPDDNTIALYHLDETDDLIDEVTGKHFALNRGAKRGVPARFLNGVHFSGDPLPEAECSSEAEFQRQLRTDTWNRALGGSTVQAGPYTRFRYKQGAISLPGLTGDPQPVLINDANTIPASARGLVTTACYGFVPNDLAQTITAFQQAGRTVQEAIDYFGAWNGSPDQFFVQEYAAHSITAVHESCLPDPGAPTSILIPGDPDLVLDAAANFTVEAIIKPDAIADDYPRAIIASRSTGLRSGESNPGETGWALCVCGCECIPNNVQWTLGDSAGNLVTVLAGVNIADGSFHHIAGVLDRDAGSALLFIDGVEIAKEPVGALGATGGATDITIGNDPALDAPFAGLIDEVRLSRAVRRSFHPVLGESDDRYRQRVAMFAPYRLPSPLTLKRGIRALSLPTSTTADEVAVRATALLLANGQPAEDGQIDLLETDSTRFCVSRQFRILPARLGSGQSIASNGASPADETAAAGAYTFHREALVRQTDATGLSFASEGARWMIVRAAQGLEALVAAVQAASSTTHVVVRSALDSTTLLHSQGRSLDITLATPGPGMDLGLLAAMAHQLGVEYVACDIEMTFARLSFAAPSDLELKSPGVVGPNAAVSVAVARPQLTNPELLQFRIVRCGSGNGTLAPDPSNPAGRRFTGLASGSVTIVAEYPVSGGTLAGSCVITIAPDTLDGCAIVDGEGRTGITEAEASGAADTDFQVAYLISSNVPKVNYASSDARRMQLPLDVALRKLAALASAEPSSPQITVLAAYDPLAPNLQAVGRGLIVGPSSSSLTAARLGALAIRSGFSYIERRRYPASVYASVAPGPRFQIVRSPLEQLWANARISGLGEFMAGEFAAAGPPDPGFTSAMLQTYSNPGVAFDAGVSNQVQAPLAGALDALVSLLAADAIGGTVEILAAFNPASADLTSVGRAVLMRHPNVAADRLSGFALAAGFGFVQHRATAPGGPAVYAAAYAVNGAPLNVFTGDNAVIGQMNELKIEPLLAVQGALDWCVTPCCGADASLRTGLPPPGTTGLAIPKVLIGDKFGTVTVNAAFSLNDAAEPYQFILEGRLRESGPPRLTKDQYDDILNFIEAYDPIGVEAITRSIRGFVHGFARPAGWSQLATSETFPPYRMEH
jgi:hypothetical protein